MTKVSIGKCEYCGEENVPVISTPETDTYCINCHRLVRDNCNDAIRKIKEFQKEHKCGTSRKKDITVLKADAENALFALTGQRIPLDD